MIKFEDLSVGDKVFYYTHWTLTPIKDTEFMGGFFHPDNSKPWEVKTINSDTVSLECGEDKQLLNTSDCVNLYPAPPPYTVQPMQLDWFQVQFLRMSHELQQVLASNKGQAAMDASHIKFLEEQLEKHVSKQG